jgi:hypothetical protein
LIFAPNVVWRANIALPSIGDLQILSTPVRDVALGAR